MINSQLASCSYSSFAYLKTNHVSWHSPDPFKNPIWWLFADGSLGNAFGKHYQDWSVLLSFVYRNASTQMKSIGESLHLKVCGTSLQIGAEGWQLQFKNSSWQLWVSFLNSIGYQYYRSKIAQAMAIDSPFYPISNVPHFVAVSEILRT